MCLQIGGEEADPQSMSREISASVREGNDPLPHTPQSWLHFKYTDVSNVNKVMRSKKLAGDGVRGVAALVAQVSLMLSASLKRLRTHGCGSWP